MNTATAITLDPRQERGRRIAQRMRIRRNAGGVYVVPSETGTGSYVVKPDGVGHRCDCPDWECRRLPCKHIYAITLTRTTERMPNGSERIVESLRVTYAQPSWPNYRLAQRMEKQRSMELLRDLCDGIAEPERAPKRGNQPLPTKERVFALVAKVFTGLSTQRNDTDIRELSARGFLAKPVSPNAIIDALNDPALTPILRSLVTESAVPLSVVESQFAVDSTGFTTGVYERWFSVKHQGVRSEAQWVKGHAIIGCRTNAVVAAKVTFGSGSDHPEFIPLLNAAAERFKIEEVSGDKAYTSNVNMIASQAVGAVPFLSFKINARGDAPASTPIWRKMFCMFEMQKEEWLSHYHQRSNVESTFSSCKRKFGGAIRSRKPVAQENEVLAKFLCHNLSMLVHAIYELGVNAVFWKDEQETAAAPELEMIDLPEVTYLAGIPTFSRVNS